MLRWLARRHGLSAEDTADAIQLTWLRCLEHIGQLTDAERLRGWLATICRRECMRLATKRRREVPLGEDDMTRLIKNESGDGDPCAEAARRDQRNRLRQAITTLPERQRLVLAELLAQEGQSYHSLSRRLGLPVGSIGPTWQRAVIRLRRDPRLAGLFTRRRRFVSLPFRPDQLQKGGRDDAVRSAGSGVPRHAGARARTS
jgi:RNA polymerase sigma factor (sigma-70 family)